MADLCFAIQADNKQQIKRLLPSYAPFYIQQGSDSVLALVATIADGMISAEAEGKELGQFDCGGTNHAIYQLEEGYKVVISTVEGRLACAMKTNANFSRCDISLLGEEKDHSFGLGNAMMIAFAFAASYYDTILMHASVTMNGGYGYLFLGKSGTGKSTHSSLWRKHIDGSDLLNDDNPAIRIQPNGQVFVYGTPWSGKTPCYRSERYRVQGIVRLAQAPHNRFLPATEVEAFSVLLPGISAIGRHERYYQLMADTLAQVALTVRVGSLECLPDEAAARLCAASLA